MAASPAEDFGQMLNKRLKNKKKKLAHVEAIEAALRDGKEMNDDQRLSLSQHEMNKGAAAELEWVLKEWTARAAAQPPPPPPPPPPPAGPSPEEVEAKCSERETASTQDTASALTRLAYFSLLFDAAGRPYAQQMEAAAAISWDAYSGKPDTLMESDLATLSEFGRQLFSRKEAASHNQSLDACMRTALLWARGEDSEMLQVGEKRVQLGRLRERLLRVVSSEFSEQLPVAVHTSAEEVKKRLGQVQIGASSRAT